MERAFVANYNYKGVVFCSFPPNANYETFPPISGGRELTTIVLRLSCKLFLSEVIVITCKLISYNWYVLSYTCF